MRERPIDNCYPLPTGVGFGGQYPGDKDDEVARAKLGALLDAGLSVFIDLTQPRELTWGGVPMKPYAHLLDEVAAERGVRAEHRRIAIRDQHAPASPAAMKEILDAIDDAERAGKKVYVHCWGGKGRTGTVANCHLIRRGYSAERSLTLIEKLACGMPKGRPPIPETDRQREFVLSWAANDPRRELAESVPRETRQATVRVDRAGALSLEARYLGAMLGMAAGDALGAAVEFKRPGSFTPVTDMRGGGPHPIPAGYWTDDTSMALCLAESLVECGGFDPADQMQRYLRWWHDGYLSSTGSCFDIGSTVSHALAEFERTGEPFCGPTAENTAGNGSLMRLAPVPLRWSHEPEQAIRFAASSSRTTHGAPQAVDACRYFAGLIVGALRGVPKDELLSPMWSPVAGLWEREPLHPSVATVAAGSFKAKSARDLPASGYVVHTLEAALWAFHTTDSFEAGALAAVNLGHDSDTTGAVYGQLAGACYGIAGIPARWLALLPMRERIEELARGLQPG